MTDAIAKARGLLEARLEEIQGERAELERALAALEGRARGRRRSRPGKRRKRGASARQ